MGDHVRTRNCNIRLVKLVLTLAFLTGVMAEAQIISPSGQEVLFSYSADMIANREEDLTVEEQIQFHASHMFGIFHSPRTLRRFGLNPDMVDGIGGPQSQMKIKVLSVKKMSAQKMAISYKAEGRMILHKKVAAQLLPLGSMTLPLPVDPYEIYDEKCTDKQYSEFGDFWYFYDPFRPGCEKLARAPLAAAVELKLKAVPTKKIETALRLDLLRGNNDNGDLFSISVVHGFSDSATARNDDGRINFRQLNEYLKMQGFSETTQFPNTNRPLHTFRKSLTLASGKTIEIEIKHLLVESDASSENISFAKFFKSAVENSDVVIYAGHSGLGANLDIPYLESKAGKFVFNNKKRQLFFFDSCSSYAYYLAPFAAEKTKSKIDVITTGLSSYFMYGQPVMESLLSILFNPKIEQIPWIDVLTKMEKPQGAATSLINVGGI
jgi:hypothetical protein